MLTRLQDHDLRVGCHVPGVDAVGGSCHERQEAKDPCEGVRMFLSFTDLREGLQSAMGCPSS